MKEEQIVLGGEPFCRCKQRNILAERRGMLYVISAWQGSGRLLPPKAPLPGEAFGPADALPAGERGFSIHYDENSLLAGERPRLGRAKRRKGVAELQPEIGDCMDTMGRITPETPPFGSLFAGLWEAPV